MKNENVSCLNIGCEYFDNLMELNCSYSEDNKKCIKTEKPIASDAVLCAVPIVAGNSYGIQFLCPACDFPEDETLTTDMKHCWNCGIKLDWSKCEY